MIRSFRDLDVWKKTIQLVKQIYIITKSFHKEEIYGLVNQVRRAAVSIPSNIAEGKARQHTKEYIQFLYIALSSCAELETHAVVSRELGYINERVEFELLEDLDHISRMLRNLIKSLRNPITANR